MALTIKDYTSKTLKDAEQYINDVKEGNIVTSRWIYLAVQRSLNDRKRDDIYFDENAVRRVYEFFSFLRIKKGRRYAQFELSPYQAWILYEVFGWFYDDGRRRYRYAVLYTARKSGKTVFSVGIELYMTMYDKEKDPEAYLCATTKEQAGQGLKYVKSIIGESRSLKRRLKVQQYQILYPKRRGLMKVLANKPDANDSLNPYVFIMDEMHAHKTLDFYNVMKSGTLSRDNPLGIITSTAGFNKEYPFFKMVDLGRRVLEGNAVDDITFYALYCLDDDDEVDNYDVWIKANPNIGVTINLKSLIAEWEKAKNTITEKYNFITKNLNRYVDQPDTWIPDDDYKLCFNKVKIPSTRIPAFIGLDLSATRDLASLVIIFEDPETQRLKVIPEFYFPQNEEKRVRKNGINIMDWIEEGYIIEHPTKTIDQNLIIERIKYWNTIFEITQINYDKWNSGFIIPTLEMDDGLYCKNFNQTTVWFNFPLRYIEKCVFDQSIDLSDNPVLRWMFRNIVIYKDGNGNIKIMKNRSLDSVDGAVSLAMAIGAYLENNNDIVKDIFDSYINEKE
ncbi:MAG: terminase large subunit [Prolixibacteraceae bacterium]